MRTLACPATPIRAWTEFGQSRIPTKPGVGRAALRLVATKGGEPFKLKGEDGKYLPDACSDSITGQLMSQVRRPLDDTDRRKSNTICFASALNWGFERDSRCIGTFRRFYTVSANLVITVTRKSCESNVAFLWKSCISPKNCLPRVIKTQSYYPELDWNTRREPVFYDPMNISKSPCVSLRARQYPKAGSC